jgi:uncharacterized lipoprotein YddW (UPF0748 family)
MKCRRLFFLLFALCSAFAAQPDEVRGLWVVRTSLCSPESIEKVISDAAENGFNTLFVQVRGRGDAFYRSRFEPRSELLKEQPEGFDPLDYLATRARQRNLRVFAWINMLLVQSPSNALLPGHVLTRHAEWSMIPKEMASELYGVRISGTGIRRIIEQARRAPEAEGVYLDPADPAVHEYLKLVCADLVSRYDLDGVHLDYARYPSAEFGYGRVALDLFATEVDGEVASATRERLHKAFRQDRLTYTRHYPVRWDNFRRRKVTELISLIRETVKEARPGILVTAAVTGDAQVAYSRKLQDWRTWMELGLLDAVCPMAYVPDTETFKNQVALARGYSFGGQVWAGIGSWQMPVASTAEKIEMARKIRCDGFILFSYGNLSSNTENALVKIRHFLARPPAFVAAEAGQ